MSHICPHCRRALSSVEFCGCEGEKQRMFNVASQPVPASSDLVERLEKKAKYTDATFSNSSLGQLYREAATTIRTLQARLDAVREEEREAINHARRLAVALWEKHFREQSPEWKPLPDLFGLIDQIDNMTTGLTAIRERSGHD